MLHAVSRVEELIDFARQHESSYKDTWQVFFLARILQNSDVYFYSTLDDRTVESAFLKPVGDINELVKDLIRAKGSSSRICVLPEGPLTIPYLK